MKKKILSLLLVLVMLLGMLPMGALAAGIPDGAPFTAVSGDADGEIVVIQLSNATGGDLETNEYGEIPHYHVVVPVGTTKVDITYPGELAQWTMTASKMDGNISVGWNSNATTSGAVISIPVADYIAVVGDSGWESGTGVMPEVGYTPITLFTFEYAADEEPEPTEPEEPEVTEVELPNGTLSPANKIEKQDEQIRYYNDPSWGDSTEYGPVAKYRVQIPSETKEVAIVFNADASLNLVYDWVTYEPTGQIYYGTLTYYDEIESLYVSGYVIRTETIAVNESDGIYSAVFPVQELIKNEQLLCVQNDGGAAIYAIEFQYAASSGGEHECVWNNGTVTKEATCQETGVLTKTCTICGETMTEEIPLADHNWNAGVIDPKPTCQTAGTKTFTCQTSGCGETKTETVAASADYHDWNAGEVTTQPTCKDKGVKTYTCQVENCGATKTEDIAKLSTHSFAADDTTQEKCSVCGTDNPNYVDPHMPQQDENGVYQIGTADQLLAFAKFVNKGNTNLKAALTADIDLTDKNWTPMSSSNAAFSFDGQGHTITFDNASNGLFSVLRGKWNSKNNYNIDTYATVENVIIDGTINGGGNVAAIVGEAYGVKIIKCLNKASITGSGNYVGGIVGLTDKNIAGNHYSNMMIDQSANTGAVQGRSGVGGLIGGMSHTNSGYLGCITNSYNWGTITGSRSGGLIGDARLSATSDSAVKIENCYNAGNPTALIGYGDGRSTITNSYYLSETDTSDRAKTNEEMEAADFVTTLGEYFRKSSTYPILSWQATSGTEYKVTAPTLAGITFNGMEMAYSDEDYIFTVKINERYRINNEFAIQINEGQIAVNYELADGVYTCTVAKENITADLIITVTGVEATKTVLYTGNSLPVNYGHVAEIAIDDVQVKNTRTEGNTIYVELYSSTSISAPVYFTVTTGGGFPPSISPGTSFTRQLNAGALTEIITAEVVNSGSASWTIVVTVDGITTYKVNLPTGTGYTVTGATAAVGGQDYTFTVALGNTYMAGDDFAVKANGQTLTPNGDGTYTVSNVASDLKITVEGVVEKPFEDPFVSIKIGDQTVAAENIELKTKDFHLGGEGESYNYRVYENVPYYHVSVPKGTTVVEVIFKEITDILVDSNDDKRAHGYDTDIDKLDTMSSATIRRQAFNYSKNEDGTQSLQIPVDGYTVNSEGGKAIGPEMEGQSNQPVALFSFLIKHLISVDSVGFNVVPEEGYSTTVLDGDAFKFTVLPKKGYSKTEDFAVKDGENVLTPDENGVYTIVNITDNKTISVIGEKTAETVSAYLSVSHDADFIKSSAEGAKVAVLQKIDVPWFDLTLYGLDQYTIPENETGYQKPTMLHMLIIATETLYCGLDASKAGLGYLYENNLMSTLLKVEQAPKSLYMKQLWGYDENLRYFYNYIYPYYEGTTTGATADRLVLAENDVVTIGHFVDWDAHNDPKNGVNYLVAGTDDKTKTAIEQGEELTLAVRRVGGGMGAVSSDVAVEAEQDLYYTKANNVSTGDITKWNKLGTTNENGVLTTEVKLEPGEYIVAVAGRYGTDNTPNQGKDNSQKICSSPGAILLTVEEKVSSDAEQDAAAVKEVYELIEALPAEVTLGNEEQIVAAREAYKDLTSAQKKFVNNLSKLEAAESALAALKDAAAAAAVDAQIEAIGEVELEDEAAIRAARIAYNILSDAQKALVTKLETLTAAEAELDRLKREANPFVDMYQATQTYLVSLDAPTVGVTDGEWRVIGLARSGKPIGDSYYDNVVSYVTENIDENGRLDKNKSTENSRVILALTALGKDVTNVGGYNLLSGLNDMDYIGNQGFNGTIWALIAFDSGNYPTPENGDVTREALIAEILRKQKSDGGWALGGDTYDSDITGMTLQALAPYYKTNEEVKAAVDKAVVCLSNVQQANGGFLTDGAPTSESAVQVITALTALGINPHTDSRFVKNGVSALDALSAYYLGDGKFEHGVGSGYNVMATEQAFYAMVAYDRFISGKTFLYDMSDVGEQPVDPVKPVESVTLDKSTATVEAGNSIQLTATVLPTDATEKAVTWSSSDEGVATVDSTGLVTAVAEGTATITVTTVDGSKTAFCDVNVTAKKSSDEEEKFYFGLSEKVIAGWVTVSFEDRGVRLSEEFNRIESKFQNPLGTIIAATQVPFKSGDSIADVTGRLLTELGMTYDFTGMINSNFYLAEIKNFTVNGTHYDSFGEFDAGQGSGWMITWNDWFIDRSTSEFEVRDGDVIRWQYTCQLGADIGDNDWLINDGKPNDDEEETATTLTPEVTVNASGEAKTEVSSSAVSGALEQAAKDGASALEIAPEIKGEVSKVEVALPADALTKIADSGLGLNVSTPIADVKLPDKAVSELAESSGKLAVTATAEEDGSITIDVSVGGKSAEALDGGLKVSLPKVGEGQVMVIVGEDGTETIVTKHIAGEDAHQAILPGSATIKVIDNRKEFSDTKGHWGESAINFVTERNLYQGIGNGLFDANGTMTRAMLVSVLYRLEGKPATGEKNTFTDVADGQWYTDAIAWANANKIVTGVGGTYFDPNAEVTREQIASVMYRYAKYLDMSTHQKGDLSQYEDNHATSDWAKDAKAWAVGAGLISGKPGNILDPGGDASRTEVASILQRLVKLMVK